MREVKLVAVGLVTIQLSDCNNVPTKPAYGLVIVTVGAEPLMLRVVKAAPVGSTTAIAVAPVVTGMVSEKTGSVWKSVPVVSVCGTTGVKLRAGFPFTSKSATRFFRTKVQAY